MNPEVFDIATMPLTWKHFKLFIISSLGQALGSGLATLIGIVVPMIQIVSVPHLTSIEQGVISSMSLLGIMVGSSFFGALSDNFGYLKLFRLCPLLILIASIFIYLTDGTIELIVGLFFMGVGVGGEYSIGANYISDLMPKRWNLLMVGASKATSALGSILVAVLSYILLMRWDTAKDWNQLFLIISALSFIMFIIRIRFIQAPSWLVEHGRAKEAEKVIKMFFGDNVVLGKEEVASIVVESEPITIHQFIKNGHIKKIIFTGIPWACEGLGVYGIGIFLPILVMSLGLESASKAPYMKILNSVEITTYINIFILIGFIIGLIIFNRFNHIKTQVYGFIVSSLGLLILLFAFLLKLPNWVSIFGFLVFEISLNAGPHLLTFVFPQQIYNVEDKGIGVGVAASIGKLGGVIGVFFIPLLLEWGGAILVLSTSIIVMLVGGIITQVYGKAIMQETVDIT